MKQFSATHPHRDLTNADYIAWKTFLDRTEGWAASEIERYQATELNRVLGLARQTPFYARRFAERGLLDVQLENTADITRFPTVSKEEVRAELTACTLAVDNLEYVTTGGSTGEPLGLYRSRRAFSRELASKAHQYQRVGWREGDRQIVLRGL